MIGIVLDTNIIVSGLLKPASKEGRILVSTLAGKFKFFVSMPILEEYEGVLKRPKFNLTEQKVVKILDKIRKIAVFISPRVKLTIVDDEPDNRFLECAEAASADYLITGNKKHFPKFWKNTKIINAREFIEAIALHLD